MARLTIRFRRADGKVAGSYADIDREQALALRDPEQNPAAALTEQHLESRLFELMFKDFRKAGDVEHDPKLPSYYLLWHAGDAEVQDLAGFEDIIFEISAATYNASEIAIRVKVGQREWRALHRRPMRAAIPGAGAGFATLAELTLRTFLADPGAINVLPSNPIHALYAAGAAQGWDRPHIRRRVFGPSFMQAGSALREAHKLVFDRDFSALVCEAARAEPEKLVALVNTARAPFQHCWIEWDRSTALEAPRLTEYDRWGALFMPHGTIEDCYELMVVMEVNSGAYVIPATFVVSLRAPIPQAAAARRPEWVLGREYLKLWSGKRHQWLDFLYAHGGYELGHPPYGPLADWRPGLVPENVANIMGGMGELASGIFREIIAGCALVATHVGGEPLVKETAARTKSLYFKGKFHPPVEYKVIQLARPMPAPHLWRRAFPRPPPVPALHHPVIGAWHHRRAPNSICAHHPRACPIALWQPVEAPEEPTDLAAEAEAEPERHDQQICVLCKRKRWWVRDHARGDPRKGMLEKGYEITRSPKPPRRKSTTP
jgi:hypothetical protein